MLDERGGISPFGWVVACTGRRPDQIEDEVRALAQWSAQQWERHFPREAGYRVRTDGLAEAAQGVRLSVQRGDFWAEATIERGSGRDGAVTAALGRHAIRAFGHARSNAMHDAHAWGERAVVRGRVVGGATGLGMFLTLAWLMIGVNNPIYVLGGMLLVVALLLTLMAGGTLGTCVGERLAELRRGVVRQRALRDPALREDMRRWKAVSRHLLAQRSALAGRRGQPFRREASALAC